ncbi:MAG: exodeoxyribonuclease VII small subunit [Bacteroidota bacterium]
MAKEEAFSLEKNLQHLRTLIEEMQKGISDFDKQLKMFQEGQEIIKACRTYLDGTELTVKQLIEGEFQDFEGS